MTDPRTTERKDLKSGRSGWEGATKGTEKRVVEKMKTMKARKEYRRQRAVNMNLENWKELSRYINKLNWQKRWRLEEARQLKKQAKV